MVHLLSGTVLFFAAVFGHWQIWLSGGGIGGFVVVAATLIEKLTGRSLSRRAHLYLFVIAFFLCSCLLAWIDEHDRGVALASQIGGLQTQVGTERNSCVAQVARLTQDVAVRDAISQTLQNQNRDQQSSINGCLSQAMKLLTPEQLKITPIFSTLIILMLPYELHVGFC